MGVFSVFFFVVFRCEGFWKVVEVVGSRCVWEERDGRVGIRGRFRIVYFCGYLKFFLGECVYVF